MSQESKNPFSRIGPGLLIAATGVGAGDLATAAFAGQELGAGVLFAVLVGAGLKFLLNEGLARFQLVTGRSLLEGACTQFGSVFAWAFMAYLIFWSFFVARALMFACGSAAASLFPVFDDLATGAAVFGILQGFLGLLFVRRGTFQGFERTMTILILAMFVIVLVMAALVWPSPAPSLMPSADAFRGDGLGWMVALLGGVGGTVTVLCYGYWLREQGWARDGVQAIPSMRLDLGVGYLVTALFGLAMVLIGSQVSSSGKGVSLLVDLATRLETELGTWARLVFLFGAWGAVFSSLLGVWQAVPYLFADLWHNARAKKGERPEKVTRRAKAYLVYGWILALPPMITLLPGATALGGFREAQKAYGIVGAAFMPMLAAALLVLAGARGPIRSKSRRNGPVVTGLLVVALVFFLWLLVRRLLG